MPRRNWSSYEKRLVACRNGWRCASCEHLLDAAYEVDHIVALENGGSDDILENGQPLCRRCHGEKTLYDNIARLKRVRCEARENVMTIDTVDALSSSERPTVAPHNADTTDGQRFPCIYREVRSENQRLPCIYREVPSVDPHVDNPFSEFEFKGWKCE